MTSTREIVVAGHICLDLFPELGAAGGREQEILPRPGELLMAGPMHLSTGGVVANTGLALHRLGAPVALMGKVGDDFLGGALLEVLGGFDQRYRESMIIAPGEATSYTLAFNPPDQDRAFLHYPGPNDTFTADDIAYEQLRGARLFHFGYPPIMTRMFEENGAQLATMFQRVRDMGPTTSLDMALPDPNSPAGKADWRAILTRTLPHVDVFLPSLDEILFMLHRDLYDAQRDAAATQPGPGLLGQIADELLAMGPALVVLKLGDCGLYLKAAADADRLARMGACGVGDPGAWAGKELQVPCFEVTVQGTTGAGDCTIAGFLAALHHRLGPEEAVEAAVAVGACSVEALDAVSGVQPWEATRARIAAGWKKRVSVMAC